MCNLLTFSHTYIQMHAFLIGPNTSTCTVGTFIVAYKATAHMQLIMEVFENWRPNL